MFLGNSRLAEYVLNTFLIFDKIRECAKGFNLLWWNYYCEKLIFDEYFVKLTFYSLYRWMKMKLKRSKTEVLMTDLMALENQTLRSP